MTRNSLNIKKLLFYKKEHQAIVWCCVFSQDGCALFSADEAGILIVHLLMDGKYKKAFEKNVCDFPIYSIDIDFINSFIVCVG